MARQKRGTVECGVESLEARQLLSVAAGSDQDAMGGAADAIVPQVIIASLPPVQVGGGQGEDGSQVAGAPSQLALSINDSSLAPGAISSPITIQLMDQDGNVATATQDTVITLSSSSEGGSFQDADGNTITTVTIPAGSDSATFSYVDSQTGTATLTVAADDGSIAATSQDLTVELLAPSQLAFYSDGQSLAPGQTSAPMTVQLLDQNGDSFTATQDTVINLSSTSEGGSFQDADGNTITSVTIPAGSDSATFSYLDSQTGTPTLTATADDASIAAASQDLTVEVLVPSQLTLSSDGQSLAPGQTSAPMTVQLLDQNGGSFTATQDTVINLSSTSEGGSFQDADGNVITSVTIAAGSDSATFSYVDSQTGTPTLTATADDASIGVATQDLTVELPVASQLSLDTVWQSVEPGAISKPITVQLLDQNYNAVNAAQDMVVTLSSSSADGRFLDAEGNAITSVTIPAGSDSASFRYSDSHKGMAQLTATSDNENVAAATQFVGVGVEFPIYYANGGTVTPLGNQRGDGQPLVFSANSAGETHYFDRLHSMIAAATLPKAATTPSSNPNAGAHNSTTPHAKRAVTGHKAKRLSHHKSLLTSTHGRWLRTLFAGSAHFGHWLRRR